MNTDLDKRYKSISEVRNSLGKLKIDYNWRSIINSNSVKKWVCFKSGKKVFELTCEKDDNSLWSISLVQFTKKSKFRKRNYCHKKLEENKLSTNLNKIFNDFF